MDGHSGLENRKVNEGGSGNFQLTLSYLKDTTGLATFVIHATSNISYSSHIQPVDFLQSIGLQYFRGECPFYHNRCFWRAIAAIPSEHDHFEHMNQVQAVHSSFKGFSDKIDDLFLMCKQEQQILQQINAQSGALKIFNAPVQLSVPPGATPLWVEQVKFQSLKDLETQQRTLQGEIEKLRSYLPLLYETGGPLVDAVVAALRFLGLAAEPTPPGFTADILAESQDGSKRFGFEVTGTNSAIKKESKKLTQLLEFERIKEHGEKTILLANTHNTKSLEEREREEHFTQQVVAFLSRHPILLMTGWDLYRMVDDVMTEAKTKEEVLNILHGQVGLLAHK